MHATGGRSVTPSVIRALALVLLAAAGLAQAQGDPKVLRIVPHSNLNILDPIWTTQYMARNHGSQGRVVEYGPAREVFARPRHEYTRQLFAAAPERSWRFGAAE